MKTKAGNEYALIGLVDMNEEKGEIPGLLLEYLRAEVIQ